MAVTVLMHMKEGKTCPHDHLRNAIDYILDVKHGEEKTKGGLLVGGNAGTNNKEILNNMLDTKRAYGKTDGRQGYHFVLSFAKGETDENTAYEVVREFCESYLGDDYDYVFAIHTDKEHLHGHIVFNSVSRTDGYKYHYKKGDWKKYIQPVTDRICEEHGLEPLTFDDKRAGVSYASWAERNQGKYNWTHIIRADVDYAIQQASSAEEFMALMKKMSYQIREGNSKKYGVYLTFSFVEPDGTVHRRRSYNLMQNREMAVAAYSPTGIAQRIATKEGSRSYESLVQNLTQKAGGYLKVGLSKSMRTYTRLYQAVSYYKLPNPYAVPAYRVRKDMLRLDRLLEECRYIKENHVTGRSALQEKTEQVKMKLEHLIAERKALYGIQNQMDEEQMLAMERYKSLQEQMTEAEKRGDEKCAEDIEDAMVELEASYWHDMLETGVRIETLGWEISGLKKELRMLSRIAATEADDIRPVWEPDIKH